MTTFQYAARIVEGDWRGARHPLVCGIRFPAKQNRFHCNFERDLPQFRTRKDDVYVVTFPKSGTTWVQEILWKIYHEEQQESSVKIGERVPCIDFCKLLESGDTGDSKRDTKPAIESLPSPRLLKSHLPYHVIPKGDSEATICKYIYVARNPKDVAVSFYNYAKSYDDGGDDCYRGPWEFFLKLFLQGQVTYGLWSDHVLGWWQHKDEKNILFLKYEDLKKDLEGQVRKIADFVGKPLSEEVVKRITTQCTFDGMSKNAPAYWLRDTAEGPNLLRKGIIGDWKNHFTLEQNARFENEFLARFEGTGLQFDFE